MSLSNAAISQIFEKTRRAAFLDAHTSARLTELRDNLIMANGSFTEIAYSVMTSGEFDEFGTSIDRSHKIQAIRRVREITACGLREAKDAVEDRDVVRRVIQWEIDQVKDNIAALGGKLAALREEYDRASF